MKTGLFLVFQLVIVAACSASANDPVGKAVEREAFIAFCISDGGTRDVCRCTFSATQRYFDEELLSKIEEVEFFTAPDAISAFSQDELMRIENFNRASDECEAKP